MSEKYAFIESEEGHYTVRQMCRWAHVSRAGYYEWKDPAPTATEQWRELMTAVVVDVFRDADGVYGARRVAAEAARRGYPLDTATAGKIMAEQGLIAVSTRKRGPRTTIPAAGDFPDLLKRDFTADQVGIKLVGDITYIPTWEGWVYLATVLDCATKKLVGYALADHMRTGLIVDALKMAARNTTIRKDVTIFHSDRGSQYMSQEFATYTDSIGIRRSVGRTGICYDNAWAESFNATLKVERVYRTVYPTRQHAIADITKWIELRYNQKRLHSALGYKTPNEAEAELLTLAA